MDSTADAEGLADTHDSCAPGRSVEVCVVGGFVAWFIRVASSHYVRHIFVVTRRNGGKLELRLASGDLATSWSTTEP